MRVSAAKNIEWMTMKQPSLFELPVEPEAPPDQRARSFAVEPEHDVVLEASAGTGKTSVLVERYVRLIEKGVQPEHILAVTFTRKAAAEMRERVLIELRKRAAAGTIKPDRWRELRERIVEIQISTIDAFCFSLLREFPLEAGVEPGFDVADETEMGRYGREAMDLAIRAARSLLTDDESLRLLFARVKLPVLSRTVESLLDRRQLALPAVASFVKRRAADATATRAAAAFIDRVRDILARSSDRHALIEQGPVNAAEFRWLRADFLALDAFEVPRDLPTLQQLRRRIERYFLTKDGDPRKKTGPAFKADQFKSPADKRVHDAAVQSLAPDFAEALASLEAGINAVLARGLLRFLHIAVSKYETLLEEHALLDFAGMLDKAVRLLEQQEEFARSRLKLQGRYHHLLVDEFQDTSRLQWRLIELLIDAWGEGEGVAGATSIFVVGDRKQSIYRFRHAEVTLLDEAARKIAALRPGRTVHQTITKSFRAVPELLSFVNALSSSIESDRPIAERFTYTERDRFPVPDVAVGALRDGEPVLGVIAESTMEACAAAVATEVQRLIGTVPVRVRDGAPRAAQPEDVAILFRARHGHQFFEAALESRGIRTYVYKGLGFFDAPEVQDLQALVRYLAQPDSDLRAAELLRSRFIRLSDPALVKLAPGFAQALLGAEPASAGAMDEIDRALLTRARDAVGGWIAQADRVPPSELVDAVIRQSAFVYELRGRRLDQARENIKKVRSVIRRVESRGYATLGRIAEYFETLRAGEESNAILEASGAVNLMTMHAAKGLEFPIVFLVNLQMPGRGRGGGVTVIEQGPDGESEVAFSSNEATALEDQRDDEELRRLLYVATTRAKDRLYLAAQLDDKGQVKRGRSLAGLLPGPLLGVFAKAAGLPVDRVDWDTTYGRFTFSVCRAAGVEMPAVSTDAAPETPLDVAWLTVDRPAPIAATAVVVDGERSATPAIPSAGGAASPRSARKTRDGEAGADSAADRLIGQLVHRLFQQGAAGIADLDDVARLAQSLVRTEERVDFSDISRVGRAAAELFDRLRSRPDVKAALASGRIYYEVPFSLAAADEAGSVIRGVIDCLIVPPDGPPTVLEFKTGVDRPEHAIQIERYGAAVRAFLAVDRVELKILYA
jgi:ATP-dependent helicase/nuclease subunit A